MEPLSDTLFISQKVKNAMKEYPGGPFIPEFERLWGKAEGDPIKYKRLLMEDTQTQFTTATALLFSEDPFLGVELDEYYELIMNSALMDIVTISEREGSLELKIGNRDITMRVHSCYVCREKKICSITDDNEVIRILFSLYGSIEGKFNIYDYDDERTVVRAIEGKYNIYTKDGIVVFGRIAEDGN